MKFKGFSISGYLKRERKNIIVSLMATCLVFALVCVKDFAEDGFYSEGEKGSLDAIEMNGRESLSTALKITGFRDGVSVERDAVIYIGGDKKEKEAAAESTGEDVRDEIKRSMDEAVRTVENAGRDRIELPMVLEDGTLLLWEKPDGREKYAVILMFPAMLLFFYKGEKEKAEKAARERRDSVIRDLPSFNSQILLLLGSGLIFEEAFAKVADGYGEKSERSYFENMVVEMSRKCRETNISAAKAMDIYSAKIGVREFSRIKEIILTAGYKGTDLSEKLADEGELLWNNRKKTAEERGKIAETKLSVPLALLLLALIGVTAAPAMMQM